MPEFTTPKFLPVQTSQARRKSPDFSGFSRSALPGGVVRAGGNDPALSPACQSTHLPGAESPGIRQNARSEKHPPRAAKAVCFALRGQLSHPWVEKRTQGHNAPHRAALRTDPPTVGSDALQQLQHSEIPGTVRDFAVSDSVTQPIRSSYM